jgi:hypothetical protein
LLLGFHKGQYYHVAVAYWWATVSEMQMLLSGEQGPQGDASHWQLEKKEEEKGLKMISFQLHDIVMAVDFFL